MSVMEVPRPLDVRRSLLPIGGALGALAGATVLIALLERWVGVPNASSAYLLAVLASALTFGTSAAVVTAVGAFLLYNFLFVPPLYTFTVADRGEVLNLILLLLMGIAVGQLAAAQRAKARTATEREREARAMFQVSRALATRSATIDVLEEIAQIIRTEGNMERVWVGLSRSGGPERVVADTAGSEGRPAPTATHSLLRRMPGDTPAQWFLVHRPAQTSSRILGVVAHRVMIEAAGRPLGSLWALRTRRAGPPGAAETRLMAASADQIGQALEQDHLAAESRAAEIAQRSDELKTALLDSVSHDLRTPLAAIRAAAGTIKDRDLRLSEDDLAESADAIDREAEYLNRLVTNLLDLSRIEAGALRAELEPVDLLEALKPIVARLAPRLADRPLQVEVSASVPSVLADAVFLDQIVTNLVENAAKYVPSGAAVRIAAAEADGRVRLTVEDAGPGVPPEALPRLFDKFYRVAGSARRSRPGSGVGLAVVRGLTQAMRGHVQARQSALGGLAVDVDLPVAAERAEIEL
jgi:two-component system sensor histidine kinase KdpD